MRKVKEANEACMLKLGWSAVFADSLWAKWFRTRYFKSSSIWYVGNLKGNSCIWKRLRSLSSYLQRDSKWIPGNGLSISLWFDKSIDHDAIAPRFPHMQFSVRDSVANII